MKSKAAAALVAVASSHVATAQRVADEASACHVSTVYIPVIQTVTATVSNGSTSLALAASASSSSAATYTTTSTSTLTSYVTITPATDSTSSSELPYVYTVDPAGTTHWINGISPSSGESVVTDTTTVFVTPSPSTRFATLSSTTLEMQYITAPTLTSTLYTYVNPDTTITSTSTSTNYVTYSLSQVSPTSSEAPLSFSSISSSGWNASTPTDPGVSPAATSSLDPQSTTLLQVYYTPHGEQSTSTTTTFTTSTVFITYTTTITPSAEVSPEFVTTITELPFTISPNSREQSSKGSSSSTVASSTVVVAAASASSSSVSGAAIVGSTSLYPTPLPFVSGTGVSAAATSFSVAVMSRSFSSAQSSSSSSLPPYASPAASNSSGVASTSSSVLNASAATSTSPSPYISPVSSSGSPSANISIAQTTSGSMATTSSASAVTNSSSTFSRSSTTPAPHLGSTVSSALRSGPASVASNSSATPSAPALSSPSSSTSPTAASFPTTLSSSSSQVTGATSTPASQSTAASAAKTSMSSSSLTSPTQSSSTQPSSTPSSSPSASKLQSSTPSATSSSLRSTRKHPSKASSSMVTTSATAPGKRSSSSSSSLPTTKSGVSPEVHSSPLAKTHSKKVQSYGQSSASTSVSSTTSNPFPASSATATPSAGCGEQGDFMIDFDNLPNFYPTKDNKTDITQAPPIPNPYYHLTFSDGYVYAPKPDEPFRPVSPPHLAVFLANAGGMAARSPSGDYSKPGEISDGPRESISAFWFDALSAWLGCDNPGHDVCTLVFSAYTWSSKEKTEIVSHKQNATIQGCQRSRDCRLRHVDFPQNFRGLTGLQIQAFVGHKQVMFFMDNLAMRWSNNSCAAGMLRQESL